MNTRSIKVHKAWALLGMVASCLIVLPANAADLETIRTFSIAPQRLETALIEFSKQADLQVIGATETLADTQTQGVSGKLTSRDALNALLENTSVAFNPVGTHSVQIVPVRDKTISRRAANDWAFRLVQADSAQDTASQSTPGNQQNRDSSQSSDNGAEITKLEEIVVTAERREVSSQKVPISMSVFSGDIQRQYLTTTAELANLVPNFQIEQFEGEIFSKATIRGLGVTDQSNALVSNSILTYFDGIASGTAVASAMPQWDLDRIEVLRGPQGTLFGRNAVGGLIQYVSAAPTKEFESYGQFTAGQFHLRRFEGAVSGPITENVQARVSALVYDRGGDVYNVVTNSRLDEREWWGVRGIVDWQISDDFDVRVKGQVWEGDIDPLFFRVVPIEFQTPADVAAAEAVGFDLDLDTASNFRKIQRPVRDQARQSDITVGEVNLNYDFGPMKLTVVGGYLEAGMLSEYTGAGFPSAFGTRDDMSLEQFSGELRLTSQTEHPLQWIAGTYYQHTEDSWDIGVDLSAPLAASTFYLESFPKQELDTQALFLHTTYDWTDRLTTTHAVRYTREEKDIAHIFNSFFEYPLSPGVAPGTPGVFNDIMNFGRLTPEQRRQQAASIIFDPNTVDANGNVVPFLLSDSSEEVTWRFAADYQLMDDALVYGSISKGFKGGIFGVFVGAPENAFAADPETSIVYEVGTKSQWWDDRLQVNVSAFYDEHKGFQAIQEVFDEVLNNFLPKLDNLPKAEIYGGEIQIQALPTENLFILANVGILESEITEVLPGNEDLLGNELPFAEDLNFSGLVRYDVPTRLGKFSPQVSWRYRGEYWSFKENNDITGKAGNFWTADVGIGHESPDGKLYGMVYLKNVFDEVRPYISGSSPHTAGKINEPRNWGVTVGYRF